MMLAIGIIGSGVFVSNGFENHYSDEVLEVIHEATNKNPYRCMEDEKFPCYIGNQNSIKAIIVGDSHADALATALAHSVDLKKNGIIALTKPDCPLILNMQITNPASECPKYNIKRMEYLDENYKDVPVFWVSRTGLYIYGQSNPSRITASTWPAPTIFFIKKLLPASYSFNF